MKHFDLESVCKASISGCYFYQNKTWCIIVKNKVDDKAVSDKLAALNNEIPDWMRLGVERHTRTLIQFQNSSGVRVLSNLKQIRGMSIDIAFVDRRLMNDSAIEILAPALAYSEGNPLNKIIPFENV